VKIPRHLLLLLLAPIVGCKDKQPDLPFAVQPAFDTQVLIETGQAAPAMVTCREVLEANREVYQAEFDDYVADPSGHWARAIPTVVRSAAMVVDDGGDHPGYAVLFEFYGASALTAWVASGEANAVLAGIHAELLSEGLDASSELFFAELLDRIVELGDKEARAAGIAPDDLANNPTGPALLDLYEQALASATEPLAPPAADDLECADPDELLLDTRDLLLGPDSYPGDSGDDLRATIKWVDIAPSEGRGWPQADPDPMCAGVAIGHAMQLLGAAPEEVSCAQWQDLGTSLLSSPKPSGGAKIHNMQAYVTSKGLKWADIVGTSEKWATEQAREARHGPGRCAVLMVWPTHVESVKTVTLWDDPQCATFTTVSWGETDTIDYKFGITTSVKTTKVADAKLGQETLLVKICK
jgi:hypothetical protein